MTKVALLVVALAAALVACGDEGAPPRTAPSDGEDTAIRPWAAPDDYSFRVRSRCGEQNFIGTFRIVVEDGRVARAEGLDGSAIAALDYMSKEEVPTLSDLLDYAREAEEAGAEVVGVDYDPDDGHPESIEFDYDTNAIDDESCFTVTAYEASGGGTSSSPASYDGTWELVEGRAPEGPIEIRERWRITLTIDGDRWGGLSACNHYGLSANVDGDSISIGGVGGTEMGCNPQVAETEARYHSALMAVDAIERSGDTLVLSGTDAELVYGFVPPPPTAKLTDVRWNLESIIHGRGPDATATSARPAHLYFDSDGTFEGSTGCRGLKGEWIEEADRVTFTRLSADDGTCSDEMAEQNDAVIGLGDGFTFDIEGDTLTVYGRFSETGLQYRAAQG
ncbi:MAG TPA: META domain-containing protein [Actinomycetota bacterium]|nr:META domain-containing protein [Actinomycetota bacterium]